MHSFRLLVCLAVAFIDFGSLHNLVIAVPVHVNLR